MINMTVDIDQKFFERAYSIRKKAAVTIAEIIALEFEELLYDAPQKSGNYVANMAVQAGTAAGGRTGGQLYFSPNPTAGQIMERGSLPAISLAKSLNPNIVANLTSHIKRRAGWLPRVTILNRLYYADKVEAYGAGQLRDENKAGAHARSKTIARLNAWFQRTIIL